MTIHALYFVEKQNPNENLQSKIGTKRQESVRTQRSTRSKSRCALTFEKLLAAVASVMAVSVTATHVQGCSARNIFDSRTRQLRGRQTKRTGKGEGQRQGQGGGEGEGNTSRWDGTKGAGGGEGGGVRETR